MPRGRPKKGQPVYISKTWRFSQTGAQEVTLEHKVYGKNKDGEPTKSWSPSYHGTLLAALMSCANRDVAAAETVADIQTRLTAIRKDILTAQRQFYARPESTNMNGGENEIQEVV